MTERPVFSECVVGYRSWKLADWVLEPVVHGNPWRPGVNRAKCEVHDDYWYDDEEPPEPHSAPEHDCTCGLHAYHEIPNRAEGDVVGAVAAWGDLQVHHNGFRAEYAQIVALVEDDGLDVVAETYGVPVVARDLLAAEAQQHGSPLPTSLRPPKPKPRKSADLSLYTQALKQVWTQPFWSTVTLPIQAPQPQQIQWSYQTISLDPSLGQQQGQSSTNLWTPADDAAKTPDEKLARYLPKKQSNRQGPTRPKRGPKKLGPGR